MGAKGISEATRALHEHFSAVNTPHSLPSDSRRVLQNVVEAYDGLISDEDSARANIELKSLWQKYVRDEPLKYGAFAGVLREILPAIKAGGDVLEWWQQVAKPVISGTNYRKSALEDAQEFTVACMVHDDDADDDEEDDSRRTPSEISDRLLSDLLEIYAARTRDLTSEDDFVAPENAQVAGQVEHVLLDFGRRQPKDLFHGLDDLVLVVSTRLQALTLLGTFLRHQTPHLYLVVNTPLVEHLLRCLMNDTSTDILSAALTSLIMLFPHIPGSLGPHLPRLFLIYSRLLCWEKFSPLSTEAQKDFVTDDRVSTGPDAERQHSDVGIDSTWEKATPKEGVIDAGTPELMAYFSFLYGMYPLNFMSYIRKPRRYLKALGFPGADKFDLDQAVIRNRSEQFSQEHLLHPNFYNLTIEEELDDPKWLKSNPDDVVAECGSLRVHGRTAPANSRPPTSGTRPDLPPVASTARTGQISPSISHASFRSGNSWRNTSSTAVSTTGVETDSLALRPSGSSGDDDLLEAPQTPSNLYEATSTLSAFSKGRVESPQTNIAYLQQDNIVLRNELNFERWHKAQYSQHISQMMRKNVKDATAEAETLNLINANRALKQRLEQVRNAREATIKDSALTRKQTNNMEANMTERFNKMKKEQETWHADAAELQRLRSEAKQYRELLVATEARELNKSHHLEIIKRDLEKMQTTQDQLHEAQLKLREYEYRELDFGRAKREQKILEREKETLRTQVQKHDEDRQRFRRAYNDKVADLEARLAALEPYQRLLSEHYSPDVHTLLQQSISESQAKLSQLKKVHSRLLEKFTDLEMEHQSAKAELDDLHSQRREPSILSEPGSDIFAFGAAHLSEAISGGFLPADNLHDAASVRDLPYDSATVTSTSDPTHRRFVSSSARGAPASSSSSAALYHASPASPWSPPGARTRNLSVSSQGSSHVPTVFNQTAPLSDHEVSLSGGGGAPSEDGSQRKHDKILPKSEVRVYGRGGAQNIKMKAKDKDKHDKSGGSMRGFKNIL